MKRLPLLFILAASAFFSSCRNEPEPLGPRPPVTPAWALGHIVWEDQYNTRKAATDLVQGYLDRDVPVSGIIIDSPWATSYNDFHWDEDRYPDPAEMTTGFQEKGVRTLLWLTGCLNNSESDEDCPVVKSDNFDEAVAKGYAINEGKESRWWKGTGVHVDFTNPEAVEWWYSQVDKALLPGVEGFKVDQGEIFHGDTVLTSLGPLTNHQFRPYYYDAMFDYVQSRRPGTGVILARPWSFQGEGRFSSTEKMSIGWCGDFSGDWDGLEFQLQNIYRSAQEGYGACGTEVGGFMGASPSKEQLIRYAQFGAMTACMVNGGMNGPFAGHLPWRHGKEAEAIYRDVVKLHYRLIPYIFSTLVEAHLHGGTLLRNVNLDEASHQLGPDFFTKAIISGDHHVRFKLPEHDEWLDWRTRRRYPGGIVVDREYPLDEFPLFVRKGAIVPLQRPNGGIELLVYPGDKPSQVQLHLPTGDGTEYTDCTVRYDPSKGKVDIQGDKARITLVSYL